MMEELSLNILDIVQNSIAADGTKIHIGIEMDDSTDRLVIQIEDNGRGMSRELLAKVENPFVTSRTTRKVGLGISFFKEAAETAGGCFQISSEEGVGTRVRAEFQKSHIDRQPLGDVAGTLSSLILLNPAIDFFLHYRVNEATFEFSTEEVREQLGGAEADLACPEVVEFISAYLSEQIEALNGGV